MLRTITIPLATMVIVGFSSVSVDAKETQSMSVEAILDMVDANLTAVNDQTYTAEVSVVRNGKTIKNMKFEAILKGLSKKKITFKAPGDMRGVTILTTEDGLMYVYMPSYKKVRRVASHVRNQGFMGTDISAEEMGTASLSRGWSGTVEAEDADHWILKLIPDADNDTEYAYLLVEVSKSYKGVSKIESYSASGKLVKSQHRTQWKAFGVITLPTLMEYRDHKTGSKTIMRFHGCKVNQGVPDSAFTKRALMRGGR